jgi:5-formyltetrahydrofolate cyclo-ligase
MKKHDLREKIKILKMEHFGNNEQDYFVSSSQMTYNVLQLPLFVSSQIVALFASKKASFEISTDGLVRKSIEMGKHVYLPRCLTQSRDLEYIRIEDLEEDTEIGVFSLREPHKNMVMEDQFKVLQNFDIVFVPGVAFDLWGNRLGFGSGYYDKFIRRIRKVSSEVAIIGLGFDFQVFSEEIPHNAKDEIVDYIITSSAILKSNH